MSPFWLPKIQMFNVKIPFLFLVPSRLYFRVGPISCTVGLWKSPRVQMIITLKSLTLQITWKMKSHSVKMLDPHSCQCQNLSGSATPATHTHHPSAIKEKNTNHQKKNKRSSKFPKFYSIKNHQKPMKNPQQKPQKSLCLHHQNPQLGAAPFASRGASRFAARRVKRWRSPSPGAPSTAEGPERGLRKYMVSVWVIYYMYACIYIYTYVYIMCR